MIEKNRALNLNEKKIIVQYNTIQYNYVGQNCILSDRIQFCRQNCILSNRIVFCPTELYSVDRILDVTNGAPYKFNQNEIYLRYNPLCLLCWYLQRYQTGTKIKFHANRDNDMKHNISSSHKTIHIYIN